MRKNLTFVFVPAMMAALLTGCGSNSNSSSSTLTANSVPVSLTMTDDPPAGVDVLFFQVSLTDATLTPASGSPVSLLNNNTPIQIDVTQLQALSAFLSTANVAAGTYNSLSLTFTSPTLVIFNQSDTAIASACAVGTVCQLTPTIASATLNFTSSPFPLMVSANNPLGLLVDFHLNKVVQPDLSVNLGVANGVSIGQLPEMPMNPELGNVTGEVETVTASQNQFTMLTRWGRTFTVSTSSATTFSDFPANACTTAGIGCVAQGQVVRVQVAGVASGGVLAAGQVTYVQASSAQTVEGTIVAMPPLPTPAGETIIRVIMHRNPDNSASFPLGGIAQVALWAQGSSNAVTTTYGIDANGFTIPAGLSFTGAASLSVGQDVALTVAPGTLSSSSGGGGGVGIWGPPPTISFTASNVELEPSQVTAMITGVDANTQSFTLGFNLAFLPWPTAAASNTTATLFKVQTTTQTTYAGFNEDSFAGLADNQFVSVSGWVFPPTASGGPLQMAAQKVELRPNGWF